MATELAKAYVQVVPSAEGIKGSLSKTLDPEAESAGKSAGKKSGASIGSALKKAIVAAGIGSAIKAAVSEGAALEQNIGGMETLYKDNADTMIKYANEAYKTAGLSANEYMETATSFSASLLSSVEGDTGKAADAANQAIIDMSDNANKFGTSMESIQNAYRGFAKQNYTMLDNLSLGYGGTKSEMQRLLADAQKLTGVKYDIQNLDDVYAAIHVIQTELGVTGTTSKEASATVSGSLASMKGAAMNLLGVIASGGDVSQAFNNLFDTVLSFANNLVPMVANVLSGIPALISTAIDALVNALGSSVTNAPALVDFAVNLIKGVANSLITGLPSLLSALVNLLVELGKAIVNYDWASVISELVTNIKTSLSTASSLFGTDNDIIGNIANGIFAGIPKALEAIGEVVAQLLQFILSKAPDLLDRGFKIVSSIGQGILNNLPAIMDSMGKVFSKIFSVIMQNLPQILQKGIEIVTKLVTGLLRALPQIVTAVAKLIGQMVKSFASYDWLKVGKDIVSGVIKGLKSMGSALWDAMKAMAKSAFDGVLDFFKIGSPSKLMADEVGYWIPPGIAEGVEGNLNPLNSAMDDVAKTSVTSLNSDFGKTTSSLAAPVPASGDNEEIVDLMSKYLPIIAERCGVKLDTDAKKIFNVVREEATEFREVTGREAFA